MGKKEREGVCGHEGFLIERRQIHPGLGLV